VALAILAATGYYFTAQQLAQRMLAGGYLLLGLMLARSFLLRCVLVRRRKLAIDHARQRRAAALAEAAASAGNSESGASSLIPTPNEPNLDLATINVQTQRFVEYSLALTGLLGMWIVWVDVLPALRVLDRIQWHTFAGADPTSLADLSLAALIITTALIAAKNAPGLLEMALLQRLPLDAGFRYTIGTVSRYVIVIVGVLVSCNIIGLTWSTVQWLVAAISVGLGFGLQEIFANFVSGLIILFERPVRVGDVVTVADITGVISRIRMRATTITNWDRKEFIVPNKEFITGRLLNWTLSDQVNRVVVNVGIAYGSDTTLAAELILGVAQDHPLVLDEPCPRVTFEEFGASSLNYVLRCFLPDMENRLQVIHELHMSIDREFRQAGIEIAFPQQDVHVRSVHADPQLFSQLFAGTTKNRNEQEEEEEEDRHQRSRHVA
jgi:potassium efflux system protein